MLGALRVIVPRVLAERLVPVMLTGEFKLMLSAERVLPERTIALVELTVICDPTRFNVPDN